MGRRWLIRIAGAAILAALLAYVPHRIREGDGYTRYLRLRDELQELERRRDALTTENAALRREACSLRDDGDTLRRVARDELGLIEPGDIVIQVERK